MTPYSLCSVNLLELRDTVSVTGRLGGKGAEEFHAFSRHTYQESVLAL